MGLNTQCRIHGNKHPDFLCPLRKGHLVFIVKIKIGGRRVAEFPIVDDAAGVFARMIKMKLPETQHCVIAGMEDGSDRVEISIEKVVWK